MVVHEKTSERTVKARFLGFGVLRPWTPSCGLATTEPVQQLELHIPAGTALSRTLPSAAIRASLVMPVAPDAVSQSLFSFDYLDREVSTAESDASEGSGSAAPRPDNSLAWILSALLHPPLPELLQDGPLQWYKPLLDHQKVGIATLLKSRELLLADDMGLGKTIQVLGALRVLYYANLIERCLVVAPASLLRQWQAEGALWAPELTVLRIAGTPQQRAALWRLPAHVHLVSYETLREDAPATPVGGRNWDVMVLDEASKIKNFDSRIARAVKRMHRTRAWALTGTPLENRIEDLHSILDFLVEPNRWRGQPLREVLSRLQLRRRKADVLSDLPPKAVTTLLLELTDQQREAYDTAERDGVYRLRKLGTALQITHVLELIIRLKQICNVDAQSGRSAKFDDIERRLESLSISGHRALIFSQFTDSNFGVAAAAERLARFNPLTYTGGLTDARRATVIERFKSDPSHTALILSLKAGGMGLNLQSASYVFHLDRWWNPAIEDQADARSHRMGQTAPVTVYRYICTNTIEERIDRLLEEKRALFADIVDGASLDLAHTLTRDELLGLFEQV